MAFEPTELLEGKARVVHEVTRTLNELFTESGLRTVLYYLETDYDTTLADSWEDPSKFRRNFVVFLGDFGGNLILQRIEMRLARHGLSIWGDLEFTDRQAESQEPSPLHP